VSVLYPVRWLLKIKPKKPLTGLNKAIECAPRFRDNTLFQYLVRGVLKINFFLRKVLQKAVDNKV